MPEYKLTYFNLRARAEISRYMFALAGVDYEDIRYDYYKQDEWLAFKPKSPFGQLPLLEYKGKTIGQSHAIERFLARQFGFAGRTEWEQARVDMLVECIQEAFLDPMFNIWFAQDEQKQSELKKKYLEHDLPVSFDKLEALLVENEDGKHNAFVGTDITLADLALAHYPTMLEIFFDRKFLDFWDRWPHLGGVCDRVANDPKIQAWKAKRPITDM